ncbi:MAG: hypothetical protein WCL41_03215 [Betaproteobacteria bacterium]
MKLWLTALCFLAANAWAEPHLQCQFELNGHSESHTFKPVSDPYLAQSIDIGGRFRFKAVLMTTGNQVDLVNLYVSYQTRRQPIILQHSKFTAPAVHGFSQANALTGRVALYSPFLGKELVYGCSLHEAAP